MGSSRPATPASPWSYKVKAAQQGTPVFGCEHCQLFFEKSIEILKCYHICLQKISKDLSCIHTWLNPQAKAITSLTPTYLCLQCSTTVPSEGRAAHGAETLHRLYVESRSGTLYCHMCDDLVWDPTLEEMKTQILRANFSSAVRKRKYNELLTSPTTPVKEDPNFMSLNTVAAPCKSASGLRGIYNMGATCYMNVILQSFVHNPLLRNFYFSEGHPSSTCQKPNCMSCSIDLMFQAFYNNEETTGYSAAGILANFWLSPRAAYVELASNKEQDAHEFFQLLSEELHEIQSATLESSSLEQRSPKKIKSSADDPTCKCIIHQTFYGKSQSTVTCDSCDDVNVQFESFLDLSLGLNLLSKTKTSQIGSLSIQNCLDAEYRKSQKVEYDCREPGCGSRFATKHLRIKNLPNVLCVQLKRFGQQHAGMGTSKIDTKVSFPLTLDMSPYTTKARADQPQNIELTKSCTYDLQTVVVHVGNLETGHYVSYSRVGDQWFKFNDHKVTLASKSQVLNEEAFLLFYVIQALV